MPPDYDQFYHYDGDGDGLRYPREYRMKWTVKWHAWPRTIQGCEEMTDFQNVLRHYDPFQPSRTAESIREKLAEILWWGYQGNRMDCINTFFNTCQANDPLLAEIQALMPVGALTNVEAITHFCGSFFGLNIPQFRRMAFGSKLLMFAAPRWLVVLDDKVYNGLRDLAANDNGVNTLVNHLEVPEWDCAIGLAGALLENFPHAVAMGEVAEPLLQAYIHWCRLCQKVAEFWRNHGQGERWQASDVERVFFSRLAGG